MGDEDLKKKKKIRGGHKGYVTKTLERIQSLLDRFEPTVVNQLKKYRIALEEKLKILGSLEMTKSSGNLKRIKSKQK